MKYLAVIAGALALSSLASSHALAAEPARQCFWLRNIDNFTVSDDEQTLYLRSSPHDIYRLDLASRCIGLGFKTNVGIKSVTGAGSICEPLDIDLIVRENGMRTPCTVTGLHKLTPDEIALLPKKLKP
jgi:hypothetical protein